MGVHATLDKRMGIHLLSFLNLLRFICQSLRSLELEEKKEGEEKRRSSEAGWR